MIDEKCLGADLDRSKVSPEAEVSGASYLTGSRTSVAAGAVVRDSRLHDACIGEGAIVIDSIIVAEGEPASILSDTAGRVVLSGADQPGARAYAQVHGSTLINTSVGPASCIRDTWAKDCRLGADCQVTAAKLRLVDADRCVRVEGPTEVSKAFLGYRACIDQRGFYEGTFSNDFLQLEFDEAAGRLSVAGRICLPHVSRYGAGTINSTNSGRLNPQPDSVLRGLGPLRGPWSAELLSKEQIELAPCCWVAPWTKVVGQSSEAHCSDRELVGDELTTYLMPFSMAGADADLTRGLVMPGELSLGIGPKHRKGAWVFTYAPDAVIRMVSRLHDALEPDRKNVADTIVVEAIRTAIAMTRDKAARHEVDLAVSADRQRPGWPRWIAATYELLKAHVEGGLWEFSQGQPTGWRQEEGRWTHPNIARLLAVAPDALDLQRSEAEIFAFEAPVAPVQVAVAAGAIDGSAGPAEIDPQAEVARSAHIGPGCRIGPGSQIGEGARLWNTVVEHSKVGAGARIERCIVTGSTIGAGSLLRSSRVTDSTLGEGADAQSAAITQSNLAPQTVVSAFGDVADVETAFDAFLGGPIRSTKITARFMSMHMPGSCSQLRVYPTQVELEGKMVEVPAAPMIGGGAVIRGSESQPVEMECCFIGSNTILECNSYIGFGCFVLGTLGPDAGLLPFTLAAGGGPERHQIGGVLGSLANVIITHFLEWTYHCCGAELAPAVGKMVESQIQRGIAAIEWELNRRTGETNGLGDEYARYCSLAAYCQQQLDLGLETYRRVLDSGAWRMNWDGEQLRFDCEAGQWTEQAGIAFWKLET